MLTKSSENESSNSDSKYVIRKNYSSAEYVASSEKFRLENPNKLVFSHLNINSIRNKFELLTNIIQGKLDILLGSGQFIIPGFAPPYRFDRNSKGGGLLLYLGEDIHSKIIFVFELPNRRFSNRSKCM